MNNAFNLGRLFGIQFRLHYTWFIIFLLITVSLSWQLFPENYPHWPFWLYWVMGIATSLLFFASVLAHELSHSLVGRANGIPVRSITLFIFGGVAHMTAEATKPGAEFRMAVAGPACSLVIAGLATLFRYLTQGTIEPLAAMFQWLAFVNLMLAVFNLIPGFPLDGGRVLRSVLWRFTGNYRVSTRAASWAGRGVGYVLILSGISIMFILRDWLSGLWLAFIGWFLENAASASYRQLRYRDALYGFTASQVMTPDCPVAPSDITVERLVQEHIFSGVRHCLLVAEDGRILGILTLQDIKSAPRPNWAETLVKDVMTPVDKLKVATPDQDALSLLEQMDAHDINQMPVVSEGKIIGLVTRDNLLRFPHLRSEISR